jgi:hypothetical protein
MTLVRSKTGMPSVMHTMREMPASAASKIAPGRAHWRHVDHRGIRFGRPNRLGDGIEDRNPGGEGLTSLPRSDPGDEPGAILEHLLGVEGAITAGDALDDEAGVPVGEDAHAAPFATSTTF